MNKSLPKIETKKLNQMAAFFNRRDLRFQTLEKVIKPEFATITDGRLSQS